MREMRTSALQDWRTPRWLFQKLHAEFAFEVDAAATEQNRLVPRYFGPDHWSGGRRDSTDFNWLTRTRCMRFFLNPPFQNIAPFLRRAVDASLDGATVVALLPARVEVAWAHDLVYPYARELRFVRGRVRYYHSTRTGKPNFPSMVVVFGPGQRVRLQVGTVGR